LKAIGGTVFKRRISALEPPWWYIISPPFTIYIVIMKNGILEVKEQQLTAPFLNPHWIMVDMVVLAQSGFSLISLMLPETANPFQLQLRI